MTKLKHWKNRSNLIMFEGNKWARQSAILVLIYVAVGSILDFLNFDRFVKTGIAWGSIALIMVAIHKSDRTEMFKGKNWQEDAGVTSIIFGALSVLVGASLAALSIDLIVVHSVVWYIRKKTGGYKKPISLANDVKIGSPF